MDCNEQLTRWLYKRLVHRYRHASLVDTYNFLFSDVQQGSGLLQQTKASDNRRKLLSSLAELKTKDVLLNYTTEDIKNGRKVTDVRYTITAAPDFIKEQKAANKRERQTFNTLLVDKPG